MENRIDLDRFFTFEIRYIPMTIEIPIISDNLNYSIENSRIPSVIFSNLFQIRIIKFKIRLILFTNSIWIRNSNHSVWNSK